MLDGPQAPQMTSTMKLNGNKLFDLTHEIEKDSEGGTLIETNVSGDQTDFDVELYYSDTEKRLSASGTSKYFGEFELSREVTIDGENVHAVASMETEKGFLNDFGLSPYSQTLDTVHKTGSYEVEGDWAASISGTNVKLGFHDRKFKLS